MPDEKVNVVWNVLLNCNFFLFKKVLFCDAWHLQECGHILDDRKQTNRASSSWRDIIDVRAWYNLTVNKEIPKHNNGLRSGSTHYNHICNSIINKISVRIFKHILSTNS